MHVCIVCDAELTWKETSLAHTKTTFSSMHEKSGLGTRLEETMFCDIQHLNVFCHTLKGIVLVPHF